MKKFERLPLEKRKAEIQMAALRLFLEKGFANTTMENIIQQVSLSKGGVYRIYPSTTMILSDLMIAGMHYRNAYYEECIQKAEQIDIQFLVHMLFHSLWIHEEYSKIYVEFLWEKQRNSLLQQAYESICQTSTIDTTKLIQKYHMDSYFLKNERLLYQIMEWMNAMILSMHVLDLKSQLQDYEDEICDAVCHIFMKKGDTL